MNKNGVMLLSIGLIALVVRAVFLIAVINVTAREVRPLEGSDAPEYLELAHNLADHGRYVNGDARSRVQGLVRTPAYPLYCSAILKLGGGDRAILWGQVPMGAAISVLVAWLALKFLRSTTLAWVSGILCAFSPTGISLSVMIAVEIPFELSVVAGFCCMLIAVERSSWRAALGAGLLWALADMIKPTLLLWPIAGAILWIVVARAQARRVRWPQLIACSLIQAIALLGWAGRNYQAERVFTVSAVGARNLRVLFVPMMQEWLKAGHEPNRADYFRHYHEVSAQDMAYLQSHGASAGKFVRMETRENQQYIFAHLLLALRVYCFDLHEQLITGWNLTDRRFYYNNQLAIPERAPRTAAEKRKQKRAREADEDRLPLIWKMYRPLGWISISPVCQWLWAGGIAGSAMTMWLVPKRRRDANWRRRVLLVAGLWITLIYFAVFAGTVFRAGSRIMYPAEFAAILLLVSNFANIVPTDERQTR